MLTDNGDGTMTLNVGLPDKNWRSKSVERWQDYDCPDSGIDFDLRDEQMVFEGDSFYCSGCGSHHIATPELVQQYEKQDGDEFARTIPLQSRATT